MSCVVLLEPLTVHVLYNHYNQHYPLFLPPIDLPPTDDLNKAFTDADTLEEATPTFSSNVGAWHILVGLLESLRRVTTLYLCQGHLRKAHTKAREGAMMARQVLLQGWYVYFMRATVWPIVHVLQHFMRATVWPIVCATALHACYCVAHCMCYRTYYSMSAV